MVAEDRDVGGRGHSISGAMGMGPAPHRWQHGEPTSFAVPMPWVPGAGAPIPW